VSDALPRTAVVMITHNRRDEVLRSLGRLTELPERPRVVVVDNGSADGTAAAVAGRFPGVEVLAAGGNLGAAARNLGLRHVAEPYVALCDDDTWSHPLGSALPRPVPRRALQVLLQERLPRAAPPLPAAGAARGRRPGRPRSDRRPPTGVPLMYTLGLNAAYHDPAACLVRAGVVLAAAEEERFTHVKHGKRPVPFSTWEPTRPSRCR
jgi:glycosyltransferase involved in cell wall biosynthesis